MKRLVAALALTTGTAYAAPRKVLVLALDGTADHATRVKLGNEVARLARLLDGTISTGESTLGDAAAAVGCTPTDAGCAEQVRQTMAVDELVWGTADAGGGKVTLTVHRTARGTAPREQVATINAGASQQDVDAPLTPLFNPAPATEPPPPQPAQPEAQPAMQPQVDAPQEDHRERNIALAMIAGGATSLLIGLALWSTESDLQDEINTAPTMTPADIQQLRTTEDKAQSYAVWGDVLVAAGLALGGYGGYRWYQDREAHKTVVTPAPVDHGAAIVVRGSW